MTSVTNANHINSAMFVIVPRFVELLGSLKVTTRRPHLSLRVQRREALITLSSNLRTTEMFKTVFFRIQFELF